MSLREQFARISYERLILGEPHIAFDGLWCLNDQFFIVCTDLARQPTVRSGQALDGFFEHAYKIMGAPVELVAAPPPDAQRLAERTATELARPAPITSLDFSDDLLLTLPVEFPRVQLRDGMATVERSLDDAERSILQTAFAKLDTGLTLTTRVDPTAFIPKPVAPVKVPSPIQRLVPSKALPASLSFDVRYETERDETFWQDNRDRILTDMRLTPRALLPPSLTVSASRCLVNAAVFPPGNIRTYLTLYRELILVAPKEPYYQEILQSLAASEDDLVWLALIGRLTVVFPDSIETYPTSLVNKLASDAPASILLSRRLAGATVADIRRRFPLCFPGLGSEDRRRVLEDIERCIPQVGGVARDFAISLRDHLSRTWAGSGNLLHRQGAMAVSRLGAAPIIADLITRVKGVDAWVELTQAASSVEWAAALGATVFPCVTKDYSEQNASEAMASIYSGLQDSTPVETNFGNVDYVLRNILTVHNDAPLRDVIEAMDGDAIDRLRKITLGLAESNLDPEFLAAAVESFNLRVRQFERKDDRLGALDLLAPVGMFVAWATDHPLLEIGAWAFKYMLNNPGGRVWDDLRGLASWTRGDAVFVSRLKRAFPR
jgi:hypothetical protein